MDAGCSVVHGLTLLCVVLAASICGRRRRSLRLDEFFVIGVSGRSLRCTVTLLCSTGAINDKTRCFWLYNVSTAP